jgi:hypothetical protein
MYTAATHSNDSDRYDVRFQTFAISCAMTINKAQGNRYKCVD